MKNLASILISIIVPTFLMSQEVKTTDVEKLGKLNLGFQGLGFSYEMPLNKNVVWVNTIGVGGWLLGSTHK